MGRAGVIELSAPVAGRARFSARVYADIGSDPEALELALSRLPPHHSKETIAVWKGLARAGATEALAAALIADHYDPAYQRSIKRNFQRVVAAQRLPMASVGQADYDAAAASLSA
jgi:tRNA 2-selenouridine synthase